MNLQKALENNEMLAEKIKALNNFCNSSSIVLYGAGLTGKRILLQLTKNKVRPLFIVDDTPSKQGTAMEGFNIVPFSHLKTIQQDYALIVTMLNPEMNFHSFKASLEARGVKNVFSFIELSFVFPDDMLPYFHFDVKDNILKDIEDAGRALNLFSEAESKELFLKNLKFRLNIDFKEIPEGDKDEYFPSSIIDIPENSVFFDCGAYDGDTVRSFIKKNEKFDAIYAFEPDPHNFDKLLHYCAGLDKRLSGKINVFNWGLSLKHGFLKFNSLNNMASSISENGEGSVIIQTIHLDGFFLPLLKDYQGTIFIKMDIEGEEPNALKGCCNLIKAKHPHLAISIYHNPDDLWRIPLYIHSLNPEYRFLLRQHGNDSMDLVLYALAE